MRAFSQPATQACSTVSDWTSTAGYGPVPATASIATTPTERCSERSGFRKPFPTWLLAGQSAPACSSRRGSRSIRSSSCRRVPRPVEPDAARGNPTCSAIRVELVDGFDVLGRRAIRVEFRIEPCIDDRLGQFRADNARAHSDDLGVVGLGGTFGGIGVVRQRRADARNLVGRDGNTNAGAAKQDGAVLLAVNDVMADLGRQVGI